MATTDTTDIAIKNENEESSPLKRPREEPSSKTGEKRQKLNHEVSSSIDDDSLQKMLAQVTEVARQQSAPVLNGEESHQGHISSPASQQSHPTGGSYEWDAKLQMRISSLPMLESLSTQILATVAQGPYSEIIRIVTETDSGLGQAYLTLIELFDKTKKDIYSLHDKTEGTYSLPENYLLSADELDIREAKDREVIRITNLAAWVSSALGRNTLSFFDLNDHFIECFTPENSPLDLETGDLFLSLKRQMYLAALSHDERTKPREEILDELVSEESLRQLLADRHSDTDLPSSELEFLESANELREFLLNEPDDDDAIQALSGAYTWESFLQEIITHLNNSYRELLAPHMKPSAPTTTSSYSYHQPNFTSTFTQQNGEIGSTSTEDDPGARAAQMLYQSFHSDNSQRQQNNVPSLPEQQSQVLPRSQSQLKLEQQSQQFPHNGSSPPHITQTEPTHVLYERARQAASVKSTTSNPRRPGLPSQRRPWTTEEEHALMAGLDIVKGPHWSSILGLYGEGGSISQVLKDRTQVQLKDKARNLKLFFLKSDTEVPYFLTAVTGDLKTRAPTQAARREAEKRARLASNEDRARSDTIIALASGSLANGGVRSSSQSTGEGNSLTPVSPASSNNMDGPEELHVVPPEQACQAPTPPKLSDEQVEDEQFAQTLMNANASSSRQQ